MKTKLLYIFLLLFCSFAANAQELTFKSFAIDPADLTARTHQVLDANGQPCALVKVGLVVPDAKFEGYIVGEYAGISSNGQFQKRTNLGSTLQYKVSKDLYHSKEGTVSVNEKQTKASVSLSPAFGSINVTSTPSGAKIVLDGQEVGTTPNVIDNLLIGSYDVVLRKQGYADFNTTARVQENQESIVVATMKEQNGMGKQNGHEYVDLGLSVKWATCNVGASKPEDYGDYFAWGETTAKTTYNWSTYTLCKGSSSTMTKYCISSSYGTVDNKTTLELADDAAYKNWGGSWRMPTKAEQDELRTKCTWTWTSQSGVNGYKVTSKSNGNSIFLPAAGSRYEGSLSDAGSDGLYWSSSLYESISYYACGLYFYSGFVDAYDGNRCYGQSVRAVCP